MTDSSLASQKRDPIKSSVGNLAAQRRRQNAVAVAKDRREALVRTKRLCRLGIGGECDDSDKHDTYMILDEEHSILEIQTSSAVEELKAAIAYQY
ncbi:Importin subunit alpha-9, partial [Bienertia sinuspersici]